MLKQVVHIFTIVLQGTSIRALFQIFTYRVDPEHAQGGVASFKNNVAELLTVVVQTGPKVAH